jgi:hypothetical protein
VAKWKQREASTNIDVNLCVVQRSSELAVALMNDLVHADSTGDDGQSCAVHKYEPLGEVLPSFAIGNYLVLDNPNATIYFMPDHKTGADDYASAVEEVSPLVSKWFGDHRESADVKPQVVEVPDPSDASFESGNMLLTSLMGSDTKLLLSAAQQVTHALFPSPRAWIHDGLASFAQVRLIEEKEGRKAAIAYLQAHRAALVDLEKASSEHKSDNDSLVGSSDDLRIRTKSMYVWWMLRDMVGENTLKAVLHDYKAANDNDPKYLQKLVEDDSHRDLHWFFDEWVYYDRGLPNFRVTSVYPSKLANGGYMVTVTVENLGGAGAEVPVMLHMQDSEASDRLMVPGKSKASVRIETPSLPQDATVNDGSVPESDTTNDVYKIQPVNQ